MAPAAVFGLCGSCETYSPGHEALLKRADTIPALLALSGRPLSVCTQAFDLAADSGFSLAVHSSDSTWTIPAGALDGASLSIGASSFFAAFVGDFILCSSSALADLS